MGRKSTRRNKNIYQTSRELANLTRDQASEKLKFISADRIERIESEKTEPHPSEILAMADCYQNPSLCNFYCSNKCPIGQEYIPETKTKELSQITLEMLSTLNILAREKERLIEITVDGQITEDEIPDFKMIQENLNNMSLAIDALKLWVERTIVSGEIDKSLLD